ncbi:MAG: FecR family protein [Chitinophagaceae bacterium]|nr:FecR family protein [Chitinophagaceae bacterium]
MQDARTFVLLGKKLNNEATEEELIELAHLLEQKDIEPHSLELLHEIWLKRQKADDSMLNEKWSSLSSRMTASSEDHAEVIPVKKRKNILLMKRFVSMAAAVIIIAISVYFFYPKTKATQIIAGVSNILDSVVSVPYGERRKIVLPDSTSVYLNSGSRLAYGRDFGSGNRNVWLKGEAFFEVTKDAAHPFLVNTDRMIVKVLGTVFNVKAYDTKEDIETTVVEGKVEVSLKEGSEKKVILLPSEKISLKNNGATRETAVAVGAGPGINYEVKTFQHDIDKMSMPEEIAWVKEKVIFTDEPFETVALKMERWYNVRIHFKNEKMKSILMNGDFDNVDIQHALQILQIMVNFKYEITDKEIYIR